MAINEADSEVYVRELLALTPLLFRNMFQAGPPKPVLPPTQVQGVLLLSVAPKLSMTQLAQRLHISRQQLTQVVEELVRKGLVEREKSPENRRVVLVCLSEKGRCLADEILRNNAERLADVLQELTESERQTILEAFSIFRTMLQRRLERTEQASSQME